jgi:hypothetical protein
MRAPAFVCVPALLIALLPGSGALAQTNVPEPPAIQRVVVMDLKGSGIATDLTRTLSQLMAFSIRTTLRDATVLAQSDIQELLALESQKQLLGCDDTSCLSQIVGALGADTVATGSVGKVGDRYLLELRLIDTREARALRQLAEEVPGNEGRLTETVAQLAASLVDPSRKAGMARLEIMGAGEVKVDGKPAGTAPLSRYEVSPGRHIVTWYAEGESVPMAEAEVTLEPFAVLKLYPGEAQRGWDLAGAYASFAFGNAPAVRVDGKKTDPAGAFHTQLGYAFDSGLTLHVGRSFQVLRTGKRAELGDVQIATDAGTVGAGYQTAGKWRLHATLDLGGGRIFSPEASFEARGGVLVEPAVSGSYSFARYFQAGVRLAETYVASEQQKVLSTSILLFVGIPSRGDGHYAQQDFHTSVAFWTMAAAVFLGAGAIASFADQVGALSLSK